VEKNTYPTTKQTQKNVATTKSNRPLLQSCEKFKTSTTTQRKSYKKNNKLKSREAGGFSANFLFNQIFSAYL
jgi:hypothetical protein